MERGYSAFLDEFTPQQLQTLDDCLAMPSWTNFGDFSELSCHAPQTGRATLPLSNALRPYVLENLYVDGSCVPLAALQSSASMSTESESCDEDGALAAVAKSRARSRLQTEQAGSSSNKSSHSTGGAASSNQHVSCGTKRSRVDSESICGVLCPFDVIKNYGMSGTMNLQQLNAKIRAVSSKMP